jgi:hypothetical protein
LGVLAMMLQRTLTTIVLKIAPPTVAFIAVMHGARLTAWAGSHEATLLLTLFALVGSLVHPQLRLIVITSLCYGVAFLAARDIFLPLNLTGLRSDFAQHVRMSALFIVSVLTLSSAVAESFSPGTVWARRCYFGGASLYFLGTGVINYHFSHSWQSILMIITGVAAAAGCAFAGQIVEMEREDAEEGPTIDDQPVESTHSAHVQALKAKEWHDPLEKADHQS